MEFPFPRIEMPNGSNHDSPQQPKSSPMRSRLPEYLENTEERLDELKSELDDQLMFDSSDEGYPGTPRRSSARKHVLRLQSSGSPHEKLQDATNVLVLNHVPKVPHGTLAFALDCVNEAQIRDKDVEVKLSKLPDLLFIYNLSSSGQKRLASYMKERYPEIHHSLTMGVPPYGYRADVTEMILDMFRRKQTDQMSYTEIYEEVPDAYLLLPEDFPFDTNRLVEVNHEGFHGLRLKTMVQTKSLDPMHLMCLISVRSLAPLVHRMISVEPRNLDLRFLEDLTAEIGRNASEIFRSAIVAPAVEGESLRKPLEHLVTCVPGVEVVWTDNKKVIRKLELPERAGAEPVPRGQVAANGPPDALRLEQDMVKILSDILKRPSNLYMSLGDLEVALNKLALRVGRSLRQFITERPKHFQILGEGDYEVVTLSHRAQIKRVCNDLQKVLRPRKPKCISSVDIAAAFANHWQTTNDADRTDRTFSVEDFGVCYLDDLLVTIPQHWGVHCSSYVSTDGEVVRRSHGNGEEDIPDFVPHDSFDRVYAWIPRHHQTEAQKKSMALLKQQVLNMFRGDPSAELLITYLTRQPRNQTLEHNRLIKLAFLRANRSSGRDNPALPYNFELEERIFVPLYHRFCGEQVTLINFGVRDLFELFDSMQDTFIASGHGQDRRISLTAGARCELLERRIIDLLRMRERSMTEDELLKAYKCQLTMSPYYNEAEIKRAIRKSKLIEKRSKIGESDKYRAVPVFQCAIAVAVQPDVGHVLMIFMLSYAPLNVAVIKDRFRSRTNRTLENSVLNYLENEGAIRPLDDYNPERVYDLHDVCRVVRNIVYKMNELPNKIYTVEREPYLGTNSLSNREVSLASILSFSGDFTFIEPEYLLKIMCDFDICFERVGDFQFKLRRELMVWVPAPEEAENIPGRRVNRGAHQMFRAPPRRRQHPRAPRHQPPNLHYQRNGHRPGGNNAH